MRAKGSAGEDALFESRFIVDMPTAGVIPKNMLSVDAEFYPGGGMLVEANYSFFSRFMAGASFGGTNIIGNGEIDWQKYPELSVKYRIFDETMSSPAVAIGFSTQGAGKYYPDSKRYQIFSPGPYLALSKNFDWTLGEISWHGGINYSIEPEPEDRHVNYWLGFEQAILGFASLNLEFNATLDDKTRAVRTEPGMLSMGLRFSIASGMTAEIQFRDMLGEQREMHSFSRLIRFEYIGRL